jgi:hypothetical protein
MKETKMALSRSDTIHYTQLAPMRPGSQLMAEWETYRREVDRLLAEGHEGKTVLIQGDTIIGLFDTRDAASEEGLRRFGTNSHLIHRVQTWEPVLYMWR